MPPDIFVTNALKAVEELEIKRIQRERETLDLLKARGDLVPFDDVAGEFAARAIAVRTKLMGVPSLFRQRMPHLALSDMEVLDALIREALEELVREESAVADDEPGDSASA
jgi:phage terminase Nu1 subunit (DNA packaging protein)